MSQSICLDEFSSLPLIHLIPRLLSGDQYDSLLSSQQVGTTDTESSWSMKTTANESDILQEHLTKTVMIDRVETNPKTQQQSNW